MSLTTTIGLFVLLMIGAFVGGCVRGEHNGETERMALIAQRDNAIASANACGAVLAEVNAQDEANQAAWNRAQSKALNAAAAAKAAAEVAEAEAARATGALLAAKQTPACKIQLETVLCASIPLL